MSVLKTIQQLIHTKRIGCEELVRFVLNGIQSKNPSVNTFIEPFGNPMIANCEVTGTTC